MIGSREKSIGDAIAKCVVPAWMANDRREPVTQERFIRGLTRTAKELHLSVDEIEDIRAGRIPKGQLRSYIPYA